MTLICGKPFIISEDGARTVHQCIECEQPELAVHPELYAELVGSFPITGRSC